VVVGEKNFLVTYMDQIVRPRRTAWKKVENFPSKNVRKNSHPPSRRRAKILSTCKKFTAAPSLPPRRFNAVLPILDSRAKRDRFIVSSKAFD